MARPKSPELTERELEVMHVFWDGGRLTTAEARERLAERGRDLAYTTVATLVKILVEKRFLKQVGDARPFAYEPRRSFDDVSGRLVGHLVKQVFQGSREQLLVRLFAGKKLSAKERRLLEEVLGDEQP